MSVPPRLEQAITVVTKAVDGDRNRNYAVALKLYGQSLELFAYATKCKTAFQRVLFRFNFDFIFRKDEAKSDNSMNAIREKSRLYADRVEKLRKYLAGLNETELQKAIVPVTAATDEDRGGNYAKALRLYEQSLAQFSHALECMEYIDISLLNSSFHWFFFFFLILLHRWSTIRRGKKWDTRERSAILRTSGEDKTFFVRSIEFAVMD